jgi:tetratricopeptide (TPR) repeat protein
MNQIKLAEDLFAKKDYIEVIRILANNNENLALILSAQAQFITGDIEQSIEKLQKVIAKDNKFFEAYILLINILIETKDYTQAQHLSAKAYLLKPNNTKIINLIGLLQFKLGNFISAKEAFEASFKIDTSNTYTKECLSDTYFMLGDFKQALKYIYSNTGRIIFDINNNKVRFLYE